MEDALMKKTMIYAMCLLTIVSLAACGTPDEQLKETSLQNDVVYARDIDYTITASSLQSFIDQFVENSAQSTNQNTTFVQAANNSNLFFENYDIKYVNYAAQQIEEGIFTGAISLDVYWNDRDSDSYYLNEGFYLSLVYDRDGTDQAAATKGFNQTNETNFYMKELDIKELNLSETAYVYLINNQYYCRYGIDNDVLEKELIVEQLAEFCREIKDSINTDIDK